jgi:menaquinol-cytochrome c reductase iron-sulfur subunit
MNKDSLPSPNERRGFLAKAVAVAFGAVACAVPIAAGLAAFLNPLRRKGAKEAEDSFRRVASLDMLPEDGTPQRFPVIADRADAWNLFPEEAIGAVFLRRTDRKSWDVEAFQVICPHAGCSITFQKTPEGGKFLCPCHTASFDLSGKRLDANSPSPRDMDTLRVKTRGNEIWVDFTNFRTGSAEKEATA